MDIEAQDDPGDGNKPDIVVPTNDLTHISKKSDLHERDIQIIKEWLGCRTTEIFDLAGFKV